MLATLLSSILLVNLSATPKAEEPGACTPAPLVGVSVRAASEGADANALIALRGRFEEPRRASVELGRGNEVYAKTTVKDGVPARLFEFSTASPEALEIRIAGVAAPFVAAATAEESGVAATWSGEGTAPYAVDILQGRASEAGKTSLVVVVSGAPAKALDALAIKLNGSKPAGTSPGTVLRSRFRPKDRKYKSKSNIVTINIYQSGASKPVWTGTTNTAASAAGLAAVGRESCPGAGEPEALRDRWSRRRPKGRKKLSVSSEGKHKR